MAERLFQILIPEAAKEMALRGPFHDEPGQPSLLPETRDALTRALRSPIGIPVVDGEFTLRQANDLLDYFSSAANWLTTMGRDVLTAYAQAVDNIRHALKVAGK